MDIILQRFFTNKIDFLYDFEQAKYQLNPLAIGLILSCTQNEVGKEIILLNCLEKIINNASDMLTKSCYLIKIYREM